MYTCEHTRFYGTDDARHPPLHTNTHISSTPTPQPPHTYTHGFASRGENNSTRVVSVFAFYYRKNATNSGRPEPNHSRRPYETIHSPHDDNHLLVAEYRQTIMSTISQIFAPCRRLNILNIPLRFTIRRARYCVLYIVSRNLLSARVNIIRV